MSIIILNYNGSGVVENCLESVLATNYPNFEVIMVDNASVDGSYQAVLKRFSKYKRLIIVRSEVNLGFAGGNNLGLKYAAGSYVSLLNNDTTVDKDWLIEAVKIAESDNKIGEVQSKLFFWYNPEVLESAGAFIDKAGYGFERGFVRGKDHFLTSEEIFYANGAAVTIKRAAIEQIQSNNMFELFDGDYFFAYEDVDISWKIRLVGLKAVVAPLSVVYHRRSTSTSRRRELLTFHHCKNRILTLVKNYSLSNLFRYLPVLIVLESIRAVSSLAGGNKSAAKAIIRAYLWNLINFKHSWTKRLAVQRFVRRMPDEYITMIMKNVNPTSLIYNQRLYKKFSEATGVNINR